MRRPGKVLYVDDPRHYPYPMRPKQEIFLRLLLRLIILVLAVVLVIVAAEQAFGFASRLSTGDIPLWAENVFVYLSDNGVTGKQHWLAEATGCVGNEALSPDQTVQCKEAFLYLSPAASVGIGLDAIANTQVAGYAAQIRNMDSRVGTVGSGRIDRAVRYDGLCYGNVGECVTLGHAEEIEFINGWKIKVAGKEVMIITPDGKAYSMLDILTRRQ